MALGAVVAAGVSAACKELTCEDAAIAIVATAQKIGVKREGVSGMGGARGGGRMSEPGHPGGINLPQRQREQIEAGQRWAIGTSPSQLAGPRGQWIKAGNGVPDAGGQWASSAAEKGDIRLGSRSPKRSSGLVLAT